MRARRPPLLKVRCFLPFVGLMTIGCRLGASYVPSWNGGAFSNQRLSSLTFVPLFADDPFLVTLKSHPDINPHTWSVWYRWFLTGLAGFLVLNASTSSVPLLFRTCRHSRLLFLPAFASSAPSGLVPSIIEHYDVSQEVGILLISIFVAGYCIGPLLWGPLSERYGRRLVFLGVWGPYIGMQVGCALCTSVLSFLCLSVFAPCRPTTTPLRVGYLCSLVDGD